MTTQLPLLSGVVVAWHGGDDLARLLESWPREPRFELVVVDNGSDETLTSSPGIRILEPATNLGFAGGVNLGVRETRGSLLLILNPDCRPRPGALERLLEGIEAHPDAAGLAPRLVGPDGRGQFGWQLRSLPSPGELLRHALHLPLPPATQVEPAAGTPVEQPAAAALLLRREAFERVGEMDERFFPAWFEDVDLARRLAEQDLVVRYWPEAEFVHRLGGSVPRLGYGRFLWIYQRNLVRYLRKHHGRSWAAAARLLLPLGHLLRIAALPLRAPRRAPDRIIALRGLLGALAGSLSGWRLPRGWRGAPEG